MEGGTAENVGVNLEVGNSISTTGQNTGVQANVYGGTSNRIVGMEGNVQGGQTSFGFNGIAHDGVDLNAGVSGTGAGDGTNFGNTGVNGTAYGTNTSNIGVAGYIDASSGSNTGSTCIGVLARFMHPTDAGDNNYGVWGDLSYITPVVNKPFYAIYGIAPGGSGVTSSTLDPVVTTLASYAGYFEGDVFCSNTYYYSDPKLKDNIVEYTGALEQLKKLPVKSYTFRNKEYPTMHLPVGDQVGVLSTDMKKTFPNLVKAAIHPNSKNDKQRVDFEAVNYNALIPVLLQAVKELDSKTDQNIQLEKKVAEQDNTIRTLSDKIDALGSCINDLCAANKQNTTTTSNTTTQIVLGQSIPNPTSGNAQISYVIGISFSQAHILIMDANGKQVQHYNIQTQGEGTITVNTTSLSGGGYKYSLIIDGRIYDTKTMVVISK